MSLKKIISGGQTGADIAGIDAAIINGVPYGGWLPQGRKTENGPLDVRYSKMTEMSVGGYQEMTEQNVKEADGTVIFTHGKYTGVSALTNNYAVKLNKPILHLDLNVISEMTAIESLIEWIYKQKIEVLNVAGSRESKDENIYDDVHSIIKSIIHILKTAEVVETPHTSPVIKDTLLKPPSQETVIATSQADDKEDATESIEKTESGTYGVFNVASLVERWPKNIRKNHLYIALAILILTVVLLIVPRGFKNSSSVNTTTKSSSLPEGRDSTTAGVLSDTPAAVEKTPKPQKPSTSQITTNTTGKAGVQTAPSDIQTDTASVAVNQLEKKGTDQKDDPAEGASDKTLPKYGDKNEPLQSLSTTSGETEKKGAVHVHAKKKTSTDRNRCGSLYKKIALGKVLKTSEAKFLANNCQ